MGVLYDHGTLWSKPTYYLTMTKFVTVLLSAAIGAFVWEVGHPYIPGLVLDHDHEETCHTH